MSLLVPGAPEFLWRLDTHAQRPALNKGQSVTPGNNSKGSYAELIDGALVTHDVWMVHICINSGASTNQARDMIVDIGIDPTAGTSYSVLIPDLVGACAGAIQVSSGGGGIHYFFPLHIPAGSSIAARASVNNGTVGSVRVYATLWGKPRRPELSRKGHVVEAIGIVSGSSRGTSVTTGTASEGSWTSLGTVTRDAWWWQMGMGMSDNSMGPFVYAMDLSAGPSGGEYVLIEEQLIFTNAAEELSTTPPPGLQARAIAAGTTIGGR